MIARCTACRAPLDNSGACSACQLALGLSVATEENSAHQSDLPPRASEAAQAAEVERQLHELNQQFNHLEVTQLIGRGGMGAIYLARQKSLDRNVALKVIASEVAGDTLFHERFQREAQMLARLSHPNIVTVFDYGRTEGGAAFLVMEYVDGINLREALKTRLSSLMEVVEIGVQICNALEYAHSKGVIHRDIKPENILLGEDGVLKVADFGIAKMVDQSYGMPALTATQQVLGSLHYLAPEQMEAPDQVDQRVDLYALGVVLYEMLTGAMPIGHFDPPSRIVEGLPPAVDNLVLRLLKRKPAERYQSAAEVKAALETIQQSGNMNQIPPAEVLENVPRSSVPFTCEHMNGFAEAIGVVNATPSGLHIEYRVRDAFIGNLKTSTKTVKIPWNQVSRLALRKGVFCSKLQIGSLSISALGDLPNAETGVIQLKIAKRDAPLASQLLQQASEIAGVNFLSPGHDAAGGPLAEEQQRDSRHAVLAALLILCGLLNAGGLAVAEIVAANSQGPAVVPSMIVMAILFGPAAALQIVTGILQAMVTIRPLIVATSVIGLLPLTPAWILSAPLAVWTLRWVLPADNRATPVPTRGKPRWGTQTLMFIRESRWSRVIAIGNALGVALLGTFLALYQWGWYPATLRFRVVAAEGSIDQDLLRSSLQQRLDRVSKTCKVQLIGTPKLVDVPGKPQRQTIAGPWYVEVRSWYREKQELADVLEIPGGVQIVWLSSQAATQSGDAMLNEQAEASSTGLPADSVASKTPSVDPGKDTQWPSSSKEWLPVGELSLPAVVKTKKAELTLSAQIATAPIDMTPAMYMQLNLSRKNDSRRPSNASEPLAGPAMQLTLELTAKGREQLVEARPTSDAAAVGLVIDGLLEGVAVGEAISNRHLTFQLADLPEVSPVALEAALRGPVLPYPLELMD